MRFLTFSFALAGLLPASAMAQPVLQQTVPARHSLNGSRTGAVELTFSQLVANPTAIRINTNQYRGRRAGTFGGAGTAQVSFQPSQPFAPGERVSVSVPASVSNPAKVVEFRAAAGRGAAVFSAPVTIGPPPSSQPSAVVAGDFDNDGDLDLLAAESSGAVMCLNNGQGQFAAQPTRLLTPNQTGDLQVLDLNGDGNLDILSCARNANNEVVLFLGTGQGTFPTRLTLLQPTFTSEVQTGDFNADGFTDIVVGTPVGTGMTLSFIPGTASGAPVVTRTTQAALSGRDLGAADMDEDGDVDLLLVTDTTLGIYLNDGTGQFTAGSTRVVNSFSGTLTTGDFNGDGHIDVVCSSYNTANVSMVLGTGTGGLGQVQNVAALSRTWKVASGDLDGDADLDLLVTNDRGITQTLLNNGQGQFSAASAILIGFEQFTMADAADLNGDGSLDVYTGHGTSNPSMPHGIDIFFNQPAVATHAVAPASALDFAAFPNPAHGQVTLQLPAGTGQATIEVYDALGRLIHAFPPQLAASAGTLTVSLLGLTPGFYAVHARTPTQRGIRWVGVE
jgi:hypothetical protein